MSQFNGRVEALGITTGNSMAHRTGTYDVHRYTGVGAERDEDVTAVEEPLEIRLVYADQREMHRRSVAVTMRTPGDDAELALGYLFSESIISSIDEVADVRPCDDPEMDPQQRANIINIHLKPSVSVDWHRLERSSFTTSSCGVCGKTSIDAVGMARCIKLPDGPSIPAEVLHRLPDLLQRRQSVFHATGGIHAAALFTSDGRLSELREDVGRHNALDKLIGARLRQRKLPAGTMILLVSGRASFELVQKALMAGVSIMAAVGAPSSLAVDLAREHRMTLVGFLRAERFNTYSGAERIVAPVSAVLD